MRQPIALQHMGDGAGWGAQHVEFFIVAGGWHSDARLVFFAI